MDGIRQIIDNPVTVKYEETQDRLKLNTHFHNSYEIIYVAQGKAVFNISGREYEIRENNLIFISNLESHNLTVTEFPYKRYYILIKPDYIQSVTGNMMLASILKNRPDYFSHVINLNNVDSPHVLGMIREIEKEAMDKEDMWEINLESYINLLLVYLYRNYREAFPLTSISKTSSVILNVQKFIENHCTESINLNDIAGRFYMDRYYLSHAFKKITGFTFREYLILQRISRARELLMHSTEDITYVCTASGFNNINNFIRTFNKYEGITPYQFRIKYRESKSI